MLSERRRHVLYAARGLRHPMSFCKRMVSASWDELKFVSRAPPSLPRVPRVGRVVKRTSGTWVETCNDNNGHVDKGFSCKPGVREDGEITMVDIMAPVSAYPRCQSLTSRGDCRLLGNENNGMACLACKFSLFDGGR